MDDALRIAACNKLKEVFARSGNVPALLDGAPPTIAAHEAAGRLGHDTLIYQVHDTVVQFADGSLHTVKPATHTWVVTLAGSAWLTTDGTYINGLYKAALRVELSKPGSPRRRYA